MKIRIIITFAFFTLLANGQNDAVVFYSILHKKLNSRQNAAYYSEIKTNNKGFLIQTDYSLRDNKWIYLNEIEIQKQNDTSYTYFHTNNPKKIYTRVFFRIDTGYKIRNYLNNILTEEGISTYIFPLIKQGQWTYYNEFSGKIRLEAIYSDNLTITNKYYISDGTFIKDVFTSTEKPPAYKGGDVELLRFIGENTNYPQKAKQKNINGRVIVTFVVMRDGSIQGIDLFQRVHEILDLEAIRVVNLIPKDSWIPAEINGEKVNAAYLIPFTFKVVR